MVTEMNLGISSLTFVMEKSSVKIDFSSHCCAIQVMFYYDDLEVANPLGSKRTKHKLGKYNINNYY